MRPLSLGRLCSSRPCVGNWCKAAHGRGRPAHRREGVLLSVLCSIGAGVSSTLSFSGFHPDTTHAPTTSIVRSRRSRRSHPFRAGAPRGRAEHRHAARPSDGFARVAAPPRHHYDWPLGPFDGDGQRRQLRTERRGAGNLYRFCPSAPTFRRHASGRNPGWRGSDSRFPDVLPSCEGRDYGDCDGARTDGV
jgi:hypothetical protein